MVIIDTKILAHRGASAYAPENTLPAFELAYEMGADGFELDVQMTKDHQIVVIHDEEIHRTSNGSGKVNEMTYEELLAFDFSNNKEGYLEVRIPLLEEVYALASSHNLFINVEIKETRYEQSYTMIQELLKLEQKYNMDGNVVYSSFNHYFLQQMKKVLPHTSIAILYMCGLVDAWEYAKKLDAEAIHPYFPNLKHETLVEECHQRGIAVRPWTVDEEEEIQYLFKIGVDAIITNKPDVVKRLK